MVEQCQGEVLVVADSTKFGRISHFKTVELGDVDLVITDSGLDPSLKEGFEAVGMDIKIV